MKIVDSEFDLSLKIGAKHLVDNALKCKNYAISQICSVLECEHNLSVVERIHMEKRNYLE